MKKKKKSPARTTWRQALINSFLLLFAGALCVIIYLIILAGDLPSLSELQRFNPDSVSKIVSADGELIHELYIHKREIVRIGEVPKDLLNLLISMEDTRFFQHSGISIRGIMRALMVDILTMSTKQGASTLTQQLARNMYNTIGFRKTINRKLREFLTAIQIERTYTKSEIMELYLNSVYFGHGTYGAQAAAKHYFGKSVSELTLDECAILVGILPAPAPYSPISHPERALQRRDLVLNVAYSRGFIDSTRLQSSLQLPLAKKDHPEAAGIASYFAEHVRRELELVDEELGVNLYKDGLIIHTTLNMDVQRALFNAFTDGIEANQETLFSEYKHDRDKLNHALSLVPYDQDSVLTILEHEGDFIPVEERKTFADSIQHLIPSVLRNQFLVQGAAIALDPKTGHILAMIGGRQEDEYADHFNRATQAVRQPGSVFKPFIYLTALENNFRPTTQLLNQPIQVCLDEACKDKWNPQNHDGSTGGLTTLRDGMRRSLNLISVRIVQELISPRQVKSNARLFGITTPIDEVEAIALGSSGVIPLEITAAYAAFANNGIYTRPLSITRIEDRYGRVIKSFTTESREVKDEALIFLTRDLMRSVVDNGTGGSIRWKYKFNRPAAGKTGTTNSKADAWFVGYTPQIALGVWVGMDNPAISLGKRQFGSQAALPIWARAMREIYKILELPKADWTQPEGIERIEICTDSYELASQWCPTDSRKYEYFLSTAKPRRSCPEHSNPFNRFQDK